MRTTPCECSLWDSAGCQPSIPSADMHLTSQSCWTQFHLPKWRIHPVSGNGYGLCRRTLLMDTLKSPQIRILPSLFGTQIIGKAQSLRSTFLITTWLSRQSNSYWTFWRRAQGTGWALENTGFAPSCSLISALKPLIVPSPDSVLVLFTRKMLCQFSLSSFGQFLPSSVGPTPFATINSSTLFCCSHTTGIQTSQLTGIWTPL